MSELKKNESPADKTFTDFIQSLFANCEQIEVTAPAKAEDPPKAPEPCCAAGCCDDEDGDTIDELVDELESADDYIERLEHDLKLTIAALLASAKEDDYAKSKRIAANAIVSCTVRDLQRWGLLPDPCEVVIKALDGE